MFLFVRLSVFDFYRPQQSCGKVMFLHLSVILFTGGFVCGPLGGHPPPGQTTPSAVHAGIRSTSGRYASYWYAFLFVHQFVCLSIRLSIHLFVFLSATVSFVHGLLVRRSSVQESTFRFSSITRCLAVTVCDTFQHCRVKWPVRRACRLVTTQPAGVVNRCD